MKLHLLQQFLDLNQAFENVVCGLEHMEKITLFDKEHLRYIRAEVEATRADASREFFDKFGEMVQKDAKWAYKFCRDHDRKTKDPFDLYLEIKDREEVRKRKGLPQRVVLLPDWDKDDEEHYDREHTQKRITNTRKKAVRKRIPRTAKRASPVRTGVALALERKP